MSLAVKGRRVPRPAPAWETPAVAALLAVFAASLLVKFGSPSLQRDGLYEHFIEALRFRETPGAGGWRAYVPPGIPFHGNLFDTLFLLFFDAFGARWFLLKVGLFASSLLTPLFAYLFVRRLLGRGAALCSLALLVAGPGFVMGSRHASTYFAPMHLFALAALWLLAVWWTGGRTRALAAGLFVLGLGGGTKIWFFWLTAALAGAGLLFAGELSRRLTPRSAAAGAAAFLAGCLPLLAQAAVHGVGEFARMAALFDSPGSRHGFGEFFANFPDCVKLMATMLEGSELFRHMFREHFAPGNPFHLWTAAAAVLWCAWEAVRRRPGWRGRLFAAFLPVVMLLFAPLSPRSSLPHTQLFFLLPFFPIALGAACSGAFAAARRRAWARAGLAAFFGLFMLIEAQNLSYHLRFIERVGGRGIFTDALDPLSDWLVTRAPGRRLFCISSGIRLQTNLFFTHSPWPLGRLADMDAAAGGEAALPVLRDFLAAGRAREALVIHHRVGRETERGLALTRETAARAGWSLRLVKEFFDGPDAAVFEVYALDPRRPR